MNEIQYIVDTTLQLGIRILMSKLRSPLMEIISTPLVVPTFGTPKPPKTTPLTPQKSNYAFIVRF